MRRRFHLTGNPAAYPLASEAGGRGGDRIGICRTPSRLPGSERTDRTGPGTIRRPYNVDWDDAANPRKAFPLVPEPSPRCSSRSPAYARLLARGGRRPGVSKPPLASFGSNARRNASPKR